MIKKKAFFSYLLQETRRDDSNKYPQCMFLGVLNTVFLNISNCLPHLDLRNRSIKNGVTTNLALYRMSV